MRAEGDVLRTKKGPVIDTAIVAGVLAAKQTHHLIPFCHPIPLEDCAITVDWNETRELVIECTVRAVHKTGGGDGGADGRRRRRLDRLRHVQVAVSRHPHSRPWADS